jgi:hypothetical protein
MLSWAAAAGATLYVLLISVLTNTNQGVHSTRRRWGSKEESHEDYFGVLTRV